MYVGVVPVSPAVQHNPDVFLLYPELHVVRHTPEASLAAVLLTVSVAVHAVTVQPVEYVMDVPGSAAHVELHPVLVFKIPGLHVKRHTPLVKAAVPLMSVAAHPDSVHVPGEYVGLVPTSSPTRAVHASQLFVFVFKIVPCKQHIVLIVESEIHFFLELSNDDPAGHVGGQPVSYCIGIQISVYCV